MQKLGIRYVYNGKIKFIPFKKHAQDAILRALLIAEAERAAKGQGE